MSVLLWAVVGAVVGLVLLFAYCAIRIHAAHEDSDTPDFPDRRDAMKLWREEVQMYYKDKGLRQVK